MLSYGLIGRRAGLVAVCAGLTIGCATVPVPAVCGSSLPAGDAPLLTQLPATAVAWPQTMYALIGVPGRSKTLLSEDGSFAPRHFAPTNNDNRDWVQRLQMLPQGLARTWLLEPPHPGYPIAGLVTQTGADSWQLTAFGALLAGQVVVDVVRIQVKTVAATAHPVRLDLALNTKAECLTLKDNLWLARGHVVAAVLPAQAIQLTAIGTRLELSQSVSIEKPVEFWLILPRRLPQNSWPALLPVDGPALLKATLGQWDQILGGIPKLQLPDGWYAPAVRTSLAYLLLLRDRVGEFAVVKPGASDYNRYWFRDAAYIVRAFDTMNLPTLAEESLRLLWRSDLPKAVEAMAAYALRISQHADGTWSAPPDEWDGQGQAIWSLVFHYQFVRDKAWLLKAWPAIYKGATRMTSARNPSDGSGGKGAEKGLLPAGYGEALYQWGRVLYHNYWGVLGMERAATAAQILGLTSESAQLRTEYEKFRADVTTAATAAYVDKGNGTGWIPAVVGAPNSRLWGTIAAVFPCEVLDPNDPKLTATFETLWQNRVWDLYKFEDVPKVWTYITADWALSLLRRDQWQRAQTLLHGYRKAASPLISWWEEYFVQTGVGTGDNPHGWAAANLVLWVRGLLVDEADGQTLTLLRGVPADWYVVGKPIVIENLPTEFGRLERLTVTTEASGKRTVTGELSWVAGDPKRQLRLYSRSDKPMVGQCTGGFSQGLDFLAVDDSKFSCVFVPK